MSRSAYALVLVPAVLVGAAFVPTAPDGSVEPPVVTLTATDYGFETPDRIPAGAVTIRLVNHGEEMHHAQLVQLREGKTVEDLGAAIASGTIPEWVAFFGGPGLVAPGMETSVTVDVRPGAYVWICFVEAPDHMPHAAKGMVHPVQVEAGRREPLPDADNTLMLNDYDFRFGRPLHAGRQVLRVRNYAAQPHEVTIIKLMPGKTMDDVMAWMSEGQQGPPPGMPMGGMQALSQGLAANITLDLEPGDYGLICFVPDAGDMQPHFMHGMMDQVTVQ